VSRLLLVDNYDSFTWNLAHLFGALPGVKVEVVRNDDPSLVTGAPGAFDGVLIGPGPGWPSEAGAMIDVIRDADSMGVPVFGVCLGLQGIGEVFGASVVHAPRQMHGKTSEITHDGRGIFAGVATPFTATRYHSLCLSHDGFPAELRVNAASEDGVIQAIEHRDRPLAAVQFHPESVLTGAGSQLAQNVVAWMRAAATPMSTCR
jgi:para-aminobenzoate synthetase component 2